MTIGETWLSWGSSDCEYFNLNFQVLNNPQAS